MSDLYHCVAPERPCRIAFAMLPGYSAISFSCAIEPLRMANQLTKKKLYTWELLSCDGVPVAASNQLVTGPVGVLDASASFDMVFVCAGVDVQARCDPRMLAWLQKMAAKDIILGGLCTGPYVLARAGVLDGYRWTVHWEHFSSIFEQSEFPAAQFTSKLFVMDRRRYTCSGGIAPLDLMLNIMRDQYGDALATAVSEEFVHERIRNNTDRQRVPLRVRIGPGQPKLLEAVGLMEANIEEPLTLDELSRYVRLSRRQLERLFRAHLDCSPTRFYLELRVKRARELLLQTPMSVLDIALACGFASSPHFSKCYHDSFGYPPSRERIRARFFDAPDVTPNDVSDTASDAR